MNLTFPVIIIFDYQGPKIVLVLREIMVILFYHLGITTCKVIYETWMFIENFLKGPALIKFMNAVLAFKDIARDGDGYQWGLDKPEDICSEHLWEICKTNVIGCDGDNITAKDRHIVLDQSLWFMMGSSM